MRSGTSTRRFNVLERRSRRTSTSSWRARCFHAEVMADPRVPLVPRILVVDDELEMASLIAEELGDRGYAVVALRSGTEALERLKHEHFDALVTDLRMPGVDGIGLLRVSRALDPTRPVIVMTGHGAIDSALAASEEGVFHYLTKPFRLAHLVELVEAALRVS
jgi:two-component system, NtrC family, response regulator HydG